IAETLPDELTKRYKDLLTMAYGRTQLDFKKVDQMIQKTGVQCLPVRSSSERKYFEYALNIELRLKKEEYVDFVRSITPLIVDLFEIILKKECKIDINKYCTVKKKNGKRTWSEEKLEGTKIGKTMESYFMGQNQRFKGGDISSIHLKVLIETFSADEHLKRLVNDVRSVETNIRNLAAHEIVSVTEETILALTGFGSEKIMAMIKELFHYTGISVRKEYWNSYDEMNAEILKRMSVNK
ncbi:type III-A CRISPR-associated CARF protein Csm6, partial [Fusicatenibacter sp.]